MKSIITIILLLGVLKSYSQNSVAHTEIKWVADSKGKRIKKEEEKQFDSRGDLIEYTQYVGNDLICAQYQYIYDQAHLIKKTESNCKGFIRTETTYTYDQLNRVVAFVDHDVPNNTNTRHFNNYTALVLSIDSTINTDNETKQVISKTIFEYYPGGLLKREIQYVTGSWFETITYKYDKDKKLIYESAQADGGIGLIEYYYIYKRNRLVKDIIKIPGSNTEYHIYETINQKDKNHSPNSNNAQ